MVLNAHFINIIPKYSKRLLPRTYKAACAHLCGRKSASTEEVKYITTTQYITTKYNCNYIISKVKYNTNNRRLVTLAEHTSDHGK